jgi:hypothetical protein
MFPAHGGVILGEEQVNKIIRQNQSHRLERER